MADVGLYTTRLGAKLDISLTPVTSSSHCYNICHCLFCIIYYVIDNIDSTITVVILYSYNRVEEQWLLYYVYTVDSIG